MYKLDLEPVPRFLSLQCAYLPHVTVRLEDKPAWDHPSPHGWVSSINLDVAARLPPGGRMIAVPLQYIYFPIMQQVNGGGVPGGAWKTETRREGDGGLW